MIKTPTTFVVGAGASVPYGLPVARDLRNQATELSAESEIFQLLHQTGEVDAPQILAFIADLRQSPTRSIDEFLATRQERPLTMKVGRLVLATLLGKFVHDARLKTFQDDWLEYLFGRMLLGARTWSEFMDGNSEVRFVTFNFDSVIEDRLTRSIRALYHGATPPPDIEQMLQAFPVIHVHGKLPPPPTQKLVADTFNAQPQQWRDWPKQAAKEIKVVLDDIDEATLAQAREAVQRATILCFLGFAYATENLARLGLPDVLKERRPNIYGSAFGMKHGEKKWVEGRLGRLGHNVNLALLESDTCLKTLEFFHIFRD